MSPLHDPTFGWGEAVRIVLMALAALNIGVLAGRVRRYVVASRRLDQQGNHTDASTLRSVVRFYSGYLLILTSTIWRVAQLYHAPVTLPLLFLTVGLAISLWGLRSMLRHVTVQMLTPAGLDALERPDDPPRRRR